MELVVKLPYPDRKLNPNARIKHWSKKTKAKAKYREWSGLAGLEAKQNNPEFPTPLESAIVQVHLFYSHHPWDRDNINAAMKPAFDGLVDAKILVDDRHLIPLPAKRTKVKPNERRVEITVRVNDGSLNFLLE